MSYLCSTQIKLNSWYPRCCLLFLTKPNYTFVVVVALYRVNWRAGAIPMLPSSPGTRTATATGRSSLTWRRGKAHRSRLLRWAQIPAFRCCSPLTVNNGKLNTNSLLPTFLVWHVLSYLAIIIIILVVPICRFWCLSSDKLVVVTLLKDVGPRLLPVWQRWQTPALLIIITFINDCLLMMMNCYFCSSKRA